MPKCIISHGNKDITMLPNLLYPSVNKKAPLGSGYRNYSKRIMMIISGAHEKFLGKISISFFTKSIHLLVPLDELGLDLFPFLHLAGLQVQLRVLVKGRHFLICVVR